MLRTGRQPKVDAPIPKVTQENLEAALLELIGKEIANRPLLTLEELDAKLLPGYTYRIDKKLCTGNGGVREYIKAFNGKWPASLIQRGIEVFIDGEEYPAEQHGWRPLSTTTIKRRNDV